MGNTRDSIGGLEELVLLAVQQLDDNAYGVTILEELRQAGRRLSIGSLYVTLSRLEAKGFVTSRLGDPTPERGGRAKKFFAITGVGSEVLAEAESSRGRIRNRLGTVGEAA